MFHRGGALGNHSFAWASTYPAFLNRAQEFQRLGVHGGRGAAAVQRPADPAGYAAKIDALLPKARQILGISGVGPPRLGAAPPSGVPPVSAQSTAPRVTAPVFDLSAQQASNTELNRLAGLPGLEAPTLIQPSQLPAPTGPTSTTRPVAPSPARSGGGPLRMPTQTGKGIIGAYGKKLIGLPYQGTHTMYGNWESQNAIDVPAPVGTPIYAFASGTIGSQIGALNSSDPHLLGLRVHVDAPGQSAYYAHLSRLTVKAGQHVQKGQLIGYSGSAAGVQHLHFAVKNGNPQRYYK